MTRRTEKAIIDTVYWCVAATVVLCVAVALWWTFEQALTTFVAGAAVNFFAYRAGWRGAEKARQ